MNYKFEIGDVVRIERGGHGFGDEDIGKWVEITGFGAYFKNDGVSIKEYDSTLETKRPGIAGFVGTNSFNTVAPVILLNTLEEQELLVKSAEHCPVNKPIHYQLTESLEVKDLMKILLGRIEQSDIGFSHFQSSCYKEAMQYLLRFMLKNGYEDLEKAQVYLTEVIENKRD